MSIRQSVYDVDLLPMIIVDKHPEWVNMYNLAWRTAFANLEYFPGTNWKPQMTCMPSMGRTWQWDSCFMTFISNYANGLLSAMNNIDNLLSQQDDDGYISMCYYSGIGGEVYGQRINPPLYSWAEWEHYRLTGNSERFPRVLPVLVKYFNWIKKNRRRENGLYWFEDTGSSGMDNSPRSAYFARDLNGSDVCFIDLACQQALNAQCISLIAKKLGDLTISNEFDNEYNSLKKLINDLHWSERDEFYYDLFDRHGEGWLPHKFISVKTAASFWAIISGVAEGFRLERLCEYLQDPEHFMTPHPIATLSKKDPNYMPLGGYWMGGVWAPINYMICHGLNEQGRAHIARNIAIKHLNAIIRTYENEGYDSIWECYSPEYFLPASREDGELVRNEFVGWSGLGPITMLIENILGFDFDASSNCISWVIGQEGRHGIKNFLFNDYKVSLVCEEFHYQNDKTVINLEVENELTLHIRKNGRSNDTKRTFLLKPGKQMIYV